MHESLVKIVPFRSFVTSFWKKTSIAFDSWTAFLHFQYTTFDNQLHACADGKADGEIAVVCSRFDRDKKIWTLVDNVKIAAGQFLYFLSLPSGRILIMSKSQFVYVYDGHEIITASSRFPFSASVFQTPFCRTAVSEDEILIGFAPVKLQNNKLGVADKLYSFRVNNTVSTKNDLCVLGNHAVIVILLVNNVKWFHITLWHHLLYTVLNWDGEVILISKDFFSNLMITFHIFWKSLISFPWTGRVLHTF